MNDKRDGKRPVRFNFGGDGGAFDKVFDGFTDDTYWNGWLNVWVEPRTYRAEIRPHFLTPLSFFENGVEQSIPPAYGPADDAILDLDKAAEIAEASGTLVSLANCYVTSEIAPED